MEKYYETLPSMLKDFCPKEEFAANVSNIWGMQKVYEVTKWPPGWPFGSVGDVPGLAEYFEWAKSQGVTNKDIVWWWNLPPIDRLLKRTSDFALGRMVMFKLVKDGLEPEEVMKKIGQALPIYIEHSSDFLPLIQRGSKELLSEDGVLPTELHNRVNQYLNSEDESIDDSLRMIRDQEKDSFSSVNAWIRNLIRAGKI